MKRFLSLLVLMACNGPAATTGDNNDDEAMMQQQATVTCGGGTMLINGVCEVTPAQTPPPVTCAQGTTFDMATSACTANITACGPNTKVVNGACRPVVRLATSIFVSTAGPISLWALERSVFESATGPEGASNALAQLIPLAVVPTGPASLAMSEVNLEPYKPYQLFYSDARVPLSEVEVQLFSSQLWRFPFRFSSLRDPAAISDVDSVFEPTAGDQFLITGDFVLHVPVPSTPPPASAAVVTAALLIPTRQDDLTIGVMSPGGVEDPMGGERGMSNLARSSDILVGPHDLLALHGTNLDSGSVLAGVFLPSGFQTGTRYACVLGPSAFCIADEDRAGDAFQVMGFVSPVQKVLINGVSGFNVGVQLSSASRMSGLDLGLSSIPPIDSVLAPLLPTGRVEMLAGGDASTVALNQSPFIVITRDSGGTYAVDSVANRGLVVVGDTTYTLLNAGTGAIDVALPGGTPASGTVAVQALSNFDYVTADCLGPTDTKMTVHNQCFAIDACGLGIDGEHVFAIYTPGALTVFDTDGARTVISASGAGPCP